MNINKTTDAIVKMAWNEISEESIAEAVCEEYMEDIKQMLMARITEAIMEEITTAIREGKYDIPF